MVNSAAKEYFSNFSDAVEFLFVNKKGGNVGGPIYQGRVYPCLHQPCCHACWFNSHDQVDFEEDMVGIISSLRVTVSSLLTTILQYRRYTDPVDRLKHFFVSPKYPVIITDVHESDRSVTRLVSIDWSSYYPQAEKYYHWLSIYHGISGLACACSAKRILESSEVRTIRRGARPCKGVCHEAQRRIGTDNSKSILVSVYDPPVEDGGNQSCEPTTVVTESSDTLQSYSRRSTMNSQGGPGLSFEQRSLDISSVDQVVIAPKELDELSRSSRTSSLRRSRGRQDIRMVSLLNILDIQDQGSSIRGKYTGVASGFSQTSQGAR